MERARLPWSPELLGSADETAERSKLHKENRKMAQKIKLKFDGTCEDCGMLLRAGVYARWFGRGKISCLDGQGCHENGHEDSPIARMVDTNTIDRNDAPISGRHYKVTGNNSLASGSSWADSEVTKGEGNSRLLDVLERIARELKNISSELLAGRTA
jgi:hypothetical protein